MTRVLILALLALSCQAASEAELRAKLDAPLLFVKRHSYTGLHIYDIFYKWSTGSGIYILENPAAPREQWTIRPLIDKTTPGSPGDGVYSDPEVSWDGERVLFSFKGSPSGSTKIFEIGVDGKQLRCLSDPSPFESIYKGSKSGQHDVWPSYLPDDRVIFSSTRPSGLVPCANSGVSTLHVMNKDGSGIRPISVNSETDFDPSVLPDGRVVFGRWEYVDKNALTIQSLWTINADGSNETAMFANNMVFPEAILDCRPVPGSDLIAATLAPHNAPPRGTIAYIDPSKGKNNPEALFNFDTPDNPTHNRGESCEPFPLDVDTVLFSGRSKGMARNAIQMTTRDGQRITLLSDPDICLHSPMLIKPRPRPALRPDRTDPSKKTGNFYVQDIYQGLEDIPRGDVKWLRVIEETSRVTASPGPRNPLNQTFLVSAALAFSTKIYHGIVPVNEDGSVHFSVPSGRAVYFQALDRDKRLVHSMRSFIQAAPGTTRSCIGCHEKPTSAPPEAPFNVEALAQAPKTLQPESWGTGYMDYPSMIQPIWDKHCTSCHGGEQGFAGRLDLTGGWTEFFNISYENLVDRREAQLNAHLIAAIDCMNGTAQYSSKVFPPRSHGSAVAPLAAIIADNHGGRIKLSPKERELIYAWIDSNGLYYGSWDYSPHGHIVKPWKDTKTKLAAEMKKAGCTSCHSNSFTSDWFNLETPELSRILRAPLAKGQGNGQGICSEQKTNPKRGRCNILRGGRYAHAVVPVDRFAPEPRPDLPAAAPKSSFASTADPHYQAMLAIIHDGREQALSQPRVDMPGAAIIPGQSRMLVPPDVPETVSSFQATVDESAIVRLTWERSAATIGLVAEVHRSDKANFVPSEDSLLHETALFSYIDEKSEPGKRHCYALVLKSNEGRSQPAYATLDVPFPPPPSVPTALVATPGAYAISLQWAHGDKQHLYHIYRQQAGKAIQRISVEPVRTAHFRDWQLKVGEPYSYHVSAIDRFGRESAPSNPANATALKLQDPVFQLANGDSPPGAQLKGQASYKDGILDLSKPGYLSLAHRSEFDLAPFFAVECWVRLAEKGEMPVILSSGRYADTGWFLQSISGRWRWHVGGISCDGGKVETGRWIHLLATLQGSELWLYQDGKQVAQQSITVPRANWQGAFLIGQYSADPKAAYQVTGQIAAVKIYHRPVSADEALAMARKPPSGK